jgi:hypothetical protein
MKNSTPPRRSSLPKSVVASCCNRTQHPAVIETPTTANTMTTKLSQDGSRNHSNILSKTILRCSVTHLAILQPAFQSSGHAIRTTKKNPALMVRCRSIQAVSPRATKVPELFGISNDYDRIAKVQSASASCRAGKRGTQQLFKEPRYGIGITPMARLLHK